LPAVIVIVVPNFPVMSVVVVFGLKLAPLGSFPIAIVTGSVM